MDFEGLLLRLYRDKVGVSESYPKSHWPECGSAERGVPIVMPDDRYALSHAVCLRGRDYIRVVHCNPKVEGWPHNDRKCACDYGNDCETWLRVRDAGQGVEQVLRRFDARAYHPVTWVQAGNRARPRCSTVKKLWTDTVTTYCNATLQSVAIWS